MPSRLARFAIMTVLAVSLCGGTALSQASQRVTFARGNDNASVKGAVTGRAYKDYILGARVGQKMGVSLITKGSAYFNILPPGSTGQAIYNSSIDGQDATGVPLPRTGDYRVRVYLMGAATRSGKAVPFQLSMTVLN